jgi:hypothetical protein
MELIKVTEARYLEDYKIVFKFNDGREKTIDFEDELWGEVFEPLKDINLFRRFTLNPFTIQWENGADFAPEFLYHYGETKKEKVSR